MANRPGSLLIIPLLIFLFPLESFPFETAFRPSAPAGTVDPKSGGTGNHGNPQSPGLSGSAMIGSEIPISVRPPYEEEDPVGAWDGKHYLVVWQSNRNGPMGIFASRLTGSGEIENPESFPVSTSPFDQLFPAIAWGEKGFLVVWQDLRSKKNWEIYGARMNASGQRTDPNDLPVGQGLRNRRHPAIAGNGETFLAVWTEERPGTGWDIVGTILTPEGKALHPQGIPISIETGDQSAPSVVWDGANYLVVWMDSRQKPSHAIYGARVSKEGKVLDPKEIPVNTDPGEHEYPSASRSANTSIVVWVDRRENSQYGLYGTRVKTPDKILDPGSVPLSKSPHLLMFPDIACQEKECFAVWEEDLPTGKKMTGIKEIIRNVNGMRLKFAENKLIFQEEPLLIAPGAPGNHFTRVSTDGRRYLVLWKDYRSGLAAVYGRIVEFPKDP